MRCEEFLQVLEQQDDSGLPEAALSHLDGCDNCRALTADLDAIRDLAVEVGADGVTPPERIWVSLRNQLEAEHMIHPPRTGARAGAWSGWWVAFQGPATAGAVLALFLAAGTTLSVRWSSPQSSARAQLEFPQDVSPVASAENVFKQEVMDVDTASVAGLREESPAVTSSIRRNLQIVDSFIAICEKSVREQPDNEMAREYLYGAYQQKAELLATAMNRSMPGGLQ